MAQKNYDKAVSSLNKAASELKTAETALKTAKSPYSIAKKAIASYQSAYDKAKTAFNKAGAVYVSALSKYNSCVSKYRTGSISKSKLVSAAKKYMKAVQNYYGGCLVGNYDISDFGTVSVSDISVSNSGNAGITGTSLLRSEDGSNIESTSDANDSISVAKTADDICRDVITAVQSLTGETISYSKGSNTLFKLSNRAAALKNVRIQSNFNTLESDYQSASAAYDTAKQSYEQLDAEKDQAVSQLDMAKEQLSQSSSSDTLTQLENELSECSLTAQQDGTVTALNATVGSVSSGMQTIATISDLDKLIVEITIEETDINNAVIGMECYITSDASDDTLYGTLTQIDPTAGETGTFGAQVTVDSKNTVLHIGMNASVTILVSRTEDVYQVPIDAVGEDDTGSYVYRNTGGEGLDMTFEKVYVTTGDTNDYYIEIESEELNEGDVIRSSSDLTQGIETGETKESSNDGFSLFGGLFSGMGGGNNMHPDGMQQNRGNRGNIPNGAGGSGGFQPGGMQ